MSSKKKMKTTMNSIKFIFKIKDREVKLIMISMISHLVKLVKKLILIILKLVEKCQRGEVLKSRLMI